MSIKKEFAIFAQKFNEMKVTPNIIASLVDGTVEGDGEIEITGFAKIEEAEKGDISFIANPKYLNYALTTKASALIVSKDFIAGDDITPTLIRVNDPYASLALLMTCFNKPEEEPKGIEEFAKVSPDAKIGKDCYIGSFSYIGKNVKLGDNVKIYPQVYLGNNVEIGNDSIIYPGVTVYNHCKIGERCILHSGSVIGSDGFGFAPINGSYKKIPQTGNVVLEDDVEIGANTTIDRATLGETRIGQGTKLDNLIQVAHNVKIGRNNVFAAQCGVAGSTQIGNNNRVGGQVGFAGHIKFGDCCEIGAQSGIHKSYGDNSRIIGYPATDIKTFAKNQIYLQRMPEIMRQIDELKKEIQQLKNNI